jgi:hypothetical protein
MGQPEGQRIGTHHECELVEHRLDREDVRERSRVRSEDDRRATCCSRCPRIGGRDVVAGYGVARAASARVPVAGRRVPAAGEASPRARPPADLGRPAKPGRDVWPWLQMSLCHDTRQPAASRAAVTSMAIAEPKGAHVSSSRRLHRTCTGRPGTARASRPHRRLRRRRRCGRSCRTFHVFHHHDRVDRRAPGAMARCRPKMPWLWLHTCTRVPSHTRRRSSATSRHAPGRPRVGGAHLSDDLASALHSSVSSTSIVVCGPCAGTSTGLLVGKHRLLRQSAAAREALRLPRRHGARPGHQAEERAVADDLDDAGSAYESRRGRRPGGRHRWPAAHHPTPQLPGSSRSEMKRGAPGHLVEQSMRGQ